jgi:hypothetical protein
MVFWVVIPSNLVDGYEHFGGACCLHLQRHNKELVGLGMQVARKMVTEIREREDEIEFGLGQYEW